MAKKVRKPTQPATEKSSRNVSHTATRNGTQTAVRKAAPGTARTTGASKHPYWGVLAMPRLGAKPEKTFELRGLDVKIDVYLGQDPDEEDEDTPLTPQDLDAAAVVFASFVAGIDDHVVAIRTAAFDRYLKLYARYFEDASARQPLRVNDAVQHFAYLGDRAQVRVAKQDVTVSFWYQLDREHGLEFRFRQDRLVAVGGFSET